MWTRDIQRRSFSFPSSRLLELSQAPKRDVVTAQVDYWILFHIYMMRSSLHWLLYVACCLVLRSSMMRNEGNKPPSLFFCRFSKLLRKSFDMLRNYLQRNGKLCSETSGNLLNFQRPGFSTFGQHYLADKYLGNQLRYPVDRDEKSWRAYDHTIHYIKTSWLSTSFPGFSPTRPTERERAGRRESRERGCLPLSPALAAKL